METAIVPGIYDPALADEDLGVGTEEAFELTRRLARQGLFVGISSGANLAGALQRVAPRTASARSPAVIVVVFCDGGEKYLSERFWDEDAGGGALMALSLQRRRRRARSARTAPRPIRTSAAARSSAAMAWSRPPWRCRTPPKRGRGGGFLVRPAGLPARPRGARRELGAELLGFYHSHPDHPARPSQYDLDHAWPFFSYIIVSVRDGVPEDMTSWRLRDDRSAFDQEESRLDMPNTIHIPTPLRPFTDKQEAVEVNGATVGELLADLTTKYDGLRKHLYTEEASCGTSSTST